MRSLAVAAQFGARLAWLWRHRLCFREVTQADQPRLFVDVSAIIRHDAQTGIQRVVRAVWTELYRRDGGGFQLVPVYATQSHGYCYAPTDFLATSQFSSNKEPVRVQAGDKFLGLDLAAHVMPKYRQQLKMWRKFGATVHVFVYDLLPLIRPHWFNRKATEHFRKWIDVVAQEGDQAFCISKQVSSDLRYFMREHHAEATLSIVSIPMGGDIANSRPSCGMSQDVSNLVDRMRFRPAILMVGTIEPRKAYDVAIAAFDYMWKEYGGEAPDLVIVGKGGWKTTVLQKAIRAHGEHGKRLHWLENVTDEDLGRLYDASRGLLVTSLGEGFGLPLSEAILHRRYVLARDLPVFREQNLPNVLYFEEDRPAPLSDQLMHLVRMGPVPFQLRIDLPTWRDCVDDLIEHLGIRQDEPPEVALLQPKT